MVGASKRLQRARNERDGSWACSGARRGVIATRVTQTAYAAGVAAGRIWGSGTNYLVGLGDATPLTTAYALEPTESIIERPAAVAAGAEHSLALDASGSVWVWGANYKGELGLPAGTLEVGAAAYRP
jgi:alpha-tubulin suppressor-like RCC1 family protein